MPLLHWLTRDADITTATHAPYRLLEEVPELSHGDRNAGNMLIQGDNLDALKALLPYYAGEVKCIFIDPPYNTRNAFEHYDDNLEHAQWLAMMYPRLELLQRMLTEDGSIWVTIGDNEGHYLKVIMDEVFGRKNFVCSFAWQKSFAKKSKAQISGSHDHILLYAKHKDKWTRNLIPREGKALKAFKNPDNDPRGLWQSVAYSVQSESADKRAEYRYLIELPSGRSVKPPAGRHWNGLPERTASMKKDGRLWFGKKGDNLPREKVFLSEVQDGIVPDTWWSHDLAGSNQESKKEMVAIFVGQEPFGTPKPELLVSRILTVASSKNDLVLDSFLGSGTTAAVAHKMGRCYLGIEMGAHALSYCAPRLQRVIEGEQGGISKLVNWKGGGGFRFYRLGVPVFDENGHVAEGIRFAPLAAHLWFVETGIPFSGQANSPFLGSYEGVGYYLLYNGILGDKRPNGGNVLTSKTLASLPPHDGEKVIFGEGCRLSAERLHTERITFRQIPYEIKAR